MTQPAAIAGGFPRLRARLEQPEASEYAGAPERSFEFGLAALLDGLQARLATVQGA